MGRGNVRDRPIKVQTTVRCLRELCRKGLRELLREWLRQRQNMCRQRSENAQNWMRCLTELRTVICVCACEMMRVRLWVLCACEMSELWAVSCELCTVSFGLWAVSCGRWAVSCEPWAVSCELWATKGEQSHLTVAKTQSCVRLSRVAGQRMNSAAFQKVLPTSPRQKRCSLHAKKREKAKNYWLVNISWWLGRFIKNEEIKFETKWTNDDRTCITMRFCLLWFIEITLWTFTL